MIPEVLEDGLKEYENKANCVNCLNRTFGIVKGKRGHTINTCPVCHYSTAIIGNFKKHMLIHSGERPFTCEVCNKSFRQKEHLRSHSIIHLTQICKKCFCVFNSKEEFENHMKTMH